MEARAQRLLCKKLGYTDDAGNYTEQALKEYISLFDGPLPEPVIKALVSLFKLDNDDFRARDDALIELAGPEFAEMLHGAGQMEETTVV
jgi:hypothetical protein